MTSPMTTASRKRDEVAATEPLMPESEREGLRFLVIYPANSGLPPYLRTAPEIEKYLSGCQHAGEEPFGEGGEHASVYAVRPGGSPVRVEFHGMRSAFDDNDYASVKVAVLIDIDRAVNVYAHLTDLHYRIDGRS